MLVEIEDTDLIKIINELPSKMRDAMLEHIVKCYADQFGEGNEPEIN